MFSCISYFSNSLNFTFLSSKYVTSAKRRKACRANSAAFRTTLIHVHCPHSLSFFIYSFVLFQDYKTKRGCYSWESRCCPSAYAIAAVLLSLWWFHIMCCEMCQHVSLNNSFMLKQTSSHFLSRPPLGEFSPLCAMPNACCSHGMLCRAFNMIYGRNTTAPIDFMRSHISWI